MSSKKQISENVKLYKSAETKVVYHEDDYVLKPITIELPKPPDYRLIDGYGLHPDDQKFIHPVMPERLVRLQNKTINGRLITIGEINQELQDNQTRYRDEIIWIKQQWRRRLYGYWFFNHGVPTFITGVNYVYTGYWNVGNDNRKDGCPDYRDRDRRFFLFGNMCWHDDNSFGFTYAKHRREGATFKAECFNYCICTQGYRRMGGIQSMSEEHAEEAFREKLVEPWKSLPWFWRAIHNQSDDPKSKIEFKPPAKKSKSGVSGSTAMALQGMIDYKNSNVNAYDSKKLYFLHHDEVGKKNPKAPVDVSERWDVTKKCLAQGPIIHGMSILTSTVGKMEHGGGREFWSICKDSMYDERNENGQTRSGLYNLFMPGYDGMDGFVDEYGMSIIEDPETPILNNRGQLVEIGARQYIQNERKALLEAKELDKLDEQTRLIPIQFRECFRPPQKDSGWNVVVLNNRIEELEDRNTVCQRGNFEWANDVPNTEVEFRPTDNGRFVVSKLMPYGQANMRFQDSDTNQWHPSPGTNMVAGADPFKFRKKTMGKGKSQGAGAVFWNRDLNIDPNDKHISKWESNKFVCTYLNAVMDKDLYSSDMLKMCIYYRAKINVEMNVEFLGEYFEDQNYSGYLIYGIKDGLLNANPGVYVGEATKQSIYRMFMTYIEYHGAYENHLDLLRQLSEVSSIEDMTRLDLFAAGGYALLGCKALEEQEQIVNTDILDIGNYFGM